jgi:AcrR family transcriptional regulator
MAAPITRPHPARPIDSATMTSRSTTGTRPEHRMLDAARAEFEQYGIRRTNMDDIARRAGVSRSTLYRRFPTKDALFEHLVLKETGALFEQLDRIAAGKDPQTAVVECFTHGFELVSTIPLVRRLVDSEPDMLFGLNNSTNGLPIRRASEMVAHSLRRSGATMSDQDLQAVSEILIRLTQSLLLNPDGQLDTSDPVAVRAYAQRYLARLVW